MGKPRSENFCKLLILDHVLTFHWCQDASAAAALARDKLVERQEKLQVEDYLIPEWLNYKHLC